MNESEEKERKNSRKEEYRCDSNQLALLLECSEKKDMTEWNNWREENPKEEIWLQGANLISANLEGAFLQHAHFKQVDLTWANLAGAKLCGAHLERARLAHVRLKGANLNTAYLGESFLWDSHLEGAKLGGAHLEEAFLKDAHLERAFLVGGHLERTEFIHTCLEEVDIRHARLEGAELFGVHLEGADFRASIVDGSTLFWGCSVDRKTDFRGVGLDSCRMDEKTKYLLQYNRRRMNCEDWYKQHPRLAWTVKAFFWISDYGRSTGRIIFTFFGLALIFAGVYYICALVNSPGIVSNLFEGKEGPVPGWLVPFRAIYFSIVTMTTLGFGDMHANCRSFFGHLFLTVQVILGYVMLGALVTRFGVLFHFGVISGEFTESKKKSKSEQ